MAKRKTGLHKRISSIFDGVPIPEKTGEPTVGGAGQAFPKAPPKLPQVPPKPQFQRAAKPPPRDIASKQPVATIPPKAKIPTGKTLRKHEKTERNRRQIVMAMLIPVLVIILVFAIVRVFRAPLPKITPPVDIEPANIIVGSSKVDWQIPELYPSTLRDPMRAVSIRTTQATSGEEEEAGQIIVTGISYQEESPLALIGTNIVHEGDEIFGATVIKINKDSVEFEMDGKRWTQEVQALHEIPQIK